MGLEIQRLSMSLSLLVPSEEPKKTKSRDKSSAPKRMPMREKNLLEGAEQGLLERDSSTPKHKSGANSQEFPKRDLGKASGSPKSSRVTTGTGSSKPVPQQPGARAGPSNTAQTQQESSKKALPDGQTNELSSMDTTTSPKNERSSEIARLRTDYEVKIATLNKQFDREITTILHAKKGHLSNMELYYNSKMAAREEQLHELEKTTKYSITRVNENMSSALKQQKESYEVKILELSHQVQRLENQNDREYAVSKRDQTTQLEALQMKFENEKETIIKDAELIRSRQSRESDLTHKNLVKSLGKLSNQVDTNKVESIRQIRELTSRADKAEEDYNILKETFDEQVATNKKELEDRCDNLQILNKKLNDKARGLENENQDLLEKIREDSKRFEKELKIRHSAYERDLIQLDRKTQETILSLQISHREEIRGCNEHRLVTEDRLRTDLEMAIRTSIREHTAELEKIQHNSQKKVNQLNSDLQEAQDSAQERERSLVLAMRRQQEVLKEEKDEYFASFELKMEELHKQFEQLFNTETTSNSDSVETERMKQYINTLKTEIGQLKTEINRLKPENNQLKPQFKVRVPTIEAFSVLSDQGSVVYSAQKSDISHDIE